jgi:5-methylcytosine-specific restriction endonuclease McrA
MRERNPRKLLTPEERRERKRAAAKVYYATHRKEILAANVVYAAAHEEEKRLYNIAYHAAHPEKGREGGRRWRAKPENREKEKIRHRKQYKDSPEKKNAANKRWRMENPEKMNAIHKEWRAANPLVVRTNRARRRAREQNAPGKPYTAAEFRTICNASSWQCSYCAAVIDVVTVEADHIVPLSRGGSSGIENIAVSCRPCNIGKGARPLAVFLKSTGRTAFGPNLLST